MCARCVSITWTILPGEISNRSPSLAISSTTKDENGASPCGTPNSAAMPAAKLLRSEIIEMALGRWKTSAAFAEQTTFISGNCSFR